MKWKLDENVPREIGDALDALGDDVDTVVGEGLRGAPDALVVRRATSEGRSLVTLDKGVGDVRKFPPSGHSGVVLLRLGREGRESALAAFRRALPTLREWGLSGRLAVVTERMVRIPFF